MNPLQGNGGWFMNVYESSMHLNISINDLNSKIQIGKLSFILPHPNVFKFLLGHILPLFDSIAPGAKSCMYHPRAGEDRPVLPTIKTPPAIERWVVEQHPRQRHLWTLWIISCVCVCVYTVSININVFIFIDIYSVYIYIYTQCVYIYNIMLVYM